MRVTIPGLGRDHTWEDGWADLPAPSDPGAWAHPGLAVLPSGDLLVVDADRPEVHVVTAAGVRRRTIPLPVHEAHGLAVEGSGTGLALWVADPGFKLRIRGAERIFDGPRAGRVVRVGMAGQVLGEIGTPPHPAYADMTFQPTAVAFSGSGGDRTVWVADGYGAHLVHRFRPDGEWLGAIAGGDDGHLRFQTPHGLLVDTRGPEPEVLVTDRAARRLQAFDLDGRYRRTIAEGVLTSPSALAPLGDLLIVGELNASLAVLDADGRLAGRIGDREGIVTEPDWPNARDAAGNLVRSPRIAAGGFHAPHGLAVTDDGAIHVAEFVIGGRLVRLAPAG